MSRSHCKTSVLDKRDEFSCEKREVEEAVLNILRLRVSRFAAGNAPFFQNAGFKMASLVRLFVMVFLGLFFFCAAASFQSIFAATFTQAYIRFDRLQSNTQTTGLICANPATAATESNVQIAFPSGTTVSSTLGNWTVSTANLPNGASPWPGIGTATSVSSQTVTFPSGDLTVGNIYCFNWTNSSALNTGAITTTASGSITTRTAGLSVIDATTYGVTITANDQVTVSAQVLPNSSDVDVSISGSEPDGSTLTEGQEITLTISYRKVTAGSIPLNLEASWEKGLITGSSSNYIDMFDYVIGSAINADDGTVPVVDTNNRTITWDIATLNQSVSAHTVTFKLRARADFPVGESASADISVTARSYSVLLATDSVSYTVEGTVQPTPTPTITPTSAPSANGPSATPGPGPSATPTPVGGTSDSGGPGSDQFSFVTIKTTAIIDTGATVEIKTNLQSSYTLEYGDSPKNLNQNITDTTLLRTHLAELQKLKPTTQYYYRVKATNGATTITSDLFTFSTSSRTQLITVGIGDVTIISNKIRLNSPAITAIIVGPEHSITFNLAVKDSQNIALMAARFQNAQVLGVSNTDMKPAIEEVRLVELLPGIFSGEILTPKTSGIYNLMIDVRDIYGSYYSKAVPYIFYITQPLTIIDAKTKLPIESAFVNVLKYEVGAQRYTPLEDIFALPYFTNERGHLDITLPVGKYLFDVTAPGYAEEKVTVELGTKVFNYPIIEMQPTLSVGSTVTYYKNSIGTINSFALASMKSFFSSQVAKDATLLFIELVLILLVLEFFSRRLNTHVFGLIYFVCETIFWYPFRFLGNSHRYKTIFVVEKNNNHLVIPGVSIIVRNDSGTVVYKTSTNLVGEAFIPVHTMHGFPLHIHTHRDGFFGNPFSISEASLNQKPSHIYMERDLNADGSLLSFVEWVAGTLNMVITDVLVLLTAAVALLFTIYQGIQRTYPFVIISFLIFVFWGLYIKQIWGIIHPKDRENKG